jgi:ABC-type sugar transport system permease subunit
VNFATNTLWFEVAVITSIFAVGLIFFGHFEAETPKWRRVLKTIVMTALASTISAVFGRIWFFVLLASLFVVGLYVHAWYLPRHGINGLTGEPKEKYYALRGWTFQDSK